MVPSQFGALLVQLRKQAGLTRDQLAHGSEMNVRTIGRLETEKAPNPTTRTVRKLGDALGLSDDQRRQFLAVAGHAPDADRAERDPVTTPSKQREPGRLPLSGPVAAAAEELALSVGTRWLREYEHQQTHGTAPLPVRWRQAGAVESDRLDDSHAVPLGAPGEQLETIAGFYRRLPSGRLVIAGEPGSGKTMLAIRLVLELLTARTDRSAAPPVPVFVRVRSWNPATTTFHDWLAGQLLRDYPSLAATTANGRTISAALVESNTILPILDGFDEIAPGLQPQALLMLNRTRLPLVLTSRPTKYGEAVQTVGALRDTAVVRLDALTARELANHLPHDAEGPGIPGATVWKSLVDELTAEPPSAAAEKVAAALRTPLMVSLVRIVYGDSAGRSPAELLIEDRFPESADIEEHLLSGYLPTVYDDRPRDAVRGDSPHWSYDQVERWLRYLARHAQQLGTSDLAWWQLGSELSLRTRALVVAFAAGLGVMVVGIVLGAPLFALADGQPLWPVVRMQCINGVLNAVAAAPLSALVYALARRTRAVMPHPARVRLRGGPARLGPALPGAKLRLRVLLAFFGGLAFGAGVALLAGTLRRAASATIIAEMITMGAVVAIALAAAVGIVSWLEAPADVEAAADPATFLRASRTTVLTQILVGGLVLGLIGGLGIRPVEHVVFDTVASGGGSLFFDPAYELGLGLVAGLSGALVFGLTLTAWGQWVVLARFWLPLTGRLPWNLLRFLDDAYDRGVLRQAGPVYEFRHDRLQNHLANKPSA